MSVGFTFSACSLFYSILLTIVFFFKKRLETIENKIYSYLIVTNLVGVILAIACFFSIKYMDIIPITNMIISKGLLIYYLTWITIFSIYVFIISIPKKHNINQILKKIVIIYVIFYIIILIFIIVLPLYFHNENGIIYSYGPSANFLYVAVPCYIIVFFICMIKNFKNLKDKKYLPLFFFIIIGTVVMIIQKINPGILLMTAMETFITFLMYFTIENPDIKMIEQLNIARNQADKANAAKTDFLSNMSHEIRTPLNAIVGFSQSLGENEDLSDEAKDQVKDILAASDNLLEIVNGVLDISKIEANKLEIVNKEYSFKKVFQELVILTKSRIGEKPIELRTSMDPTIPPVLYGDYVRLKQIILNLLTNAAKYTKEGYIEFKVSSVQKDEICRLIISVEDTGIGIAKEKIDKLFTKFERLDLEENITIEGTGLGLAITKKLVELMNGRIVVQSDYGFGSKFTVAIDQKIMEGVVLEDSKTGIIPQVGNIVGKKVLVVDDNALNLKVASMLLKKYSLMVETVSSGFECIEKWKRGERYDLILMDDMMPKMSGSETLKHLKEDPSFQTPVVALTANAISGMREKYLSDGFDDYLAKPIDRTELDRVLEHYLKK